MSGYAAAAPVVPAVRRTRHTEFPPVKLSRSHFMLGHLVHSVLRYGGTATGGIGTIRDRTLPVGRALLSTLRRRGQFSRVLELRYLQPDEVTVGHGTGKVQVGRI